MLAREAGPVDLLIVICPVKDDKSDKVSKIFCLLVLLCCKCMTLWLSTVSFKVWDFYFCCSNKLSSLPLDHPCNTHVLVARNLGGVVKLVSWFTLCSLSLNCNAVVLSLGYIVTVITVWIKRIQRISVD